MEGVAFLHCAYPKVTIYSIHHTRASCQCTHTHTTRGANTHTQTYKLTPPHPLTHLPPPPPHTHTYTHTKHTHTHTCHLPRAVFAVQKRLGPPLTSPAVIPALYLPIPNSLPDLCSAAAAAAEVSGLGRSGWWVPFEGCQVDCWGSWYLPRPSQAMRAPVCVCVYVCVCVCVCKQCVCGKFYASLPLAICTLNQGP